MGRFFTSTQIYNPKQLGRDEFKAYFYERMKKEGYEACVADCAELSYVLVFADNRKWVTLSSEAYEQGNRTSQDDTARIAKMLGTYCVNTIVIDSDCAMLDLYDDEGKKADTAVMGRADDYLGDDIPVPVKTVWEQFVSPDSTWEQFMSVVQGDYIFVEDGLSELAPVIGMDSGNILFEYEDADDGSESCCYLSFRKTGSKKEKKLTLNAAFKQVFGETLEPLGFKKPKLRQPYYIRMVSDEILHIIGIHDMKTHLMLFGGVATVYRETLCLNQTFRQNENWLKPAMHFYVKWHASEKSLDPQIQSGFHYRKDLGPQSIHNAMLGALDAAVTWILPILNQVQTLKDVLDFDRNNGVVLSVPLQKSPVAPYCDTAIQFLLKNPLADLEERYAITLKAIAEEDARLHRTPEAISQWRAEYELMVNESRRRIHLFLEDTDLRRQTLEELAKRKAQNIELLRQYGIF